MHLNGKNLSHLFTIRLWIDYLDRESAVLRIRVQHVLSGEVHYFQTWEEVVAFINEQSVSQKVNSHRMEEKE